MLKNWKERKVNRFLPTKGILTKNDSCHRIGAQKGLSEGCFSAQGPVRRWLRKAAILLAAFVFPFFLMSESLALSLGKIEVKSKYGEPFHAEIELIADSVEGISVVIGQAGEYKRMQLARPRVVDQLYVKRSFLTRGNKTFIQVVSDSPLFFPSFNLVVGAKKGGGIILENYLITVDFQKSVSYKGVKSGGDLAAVPSSSSMVPGSDKGLLQKRNGRLDSGKAEFKTSSPGRSSAIVARKPVPLEKGELPSPPVTKVSPKPEPITEPPGEDEVVSAFPSSTMSKTPARSAKRDPFRPALEGEAFQPLRPSESKKYGPLSSGDSLKKIADALNFDPSESDRVAVALWRDNKDKFINGNIHGLKSGVELEIGNLKNRMQELDNREARQIIQSHWQEWKLIQPTSGPLVDKVPGQASKTFLAQADQGELKNKIASIMGEWKDSWEKEDLDRHMALFYKPPDGRASQGTGSNYEYWRRFKKMMFGRHDKALIDIQNLDITIRDNRIIAKFDQSFESNRMKSFGRKTIEFVPVGSEWKILREKFVVEEFLDKEKTSSTVTRTPVRKALRAPKEGKAPIVIHASTQVNFSSSTDLVDELRLLGFNAYFSPAFVTETKKIYRIFVGRFSEWKPAEELTRSLKKIDITRNAVPMSFPYVLQAGKHLTREDAEKQIKELRAKGLSGIMFSDKSVFIGAFQVKENAERMARDMVELGLPVVIRTP